APINASNHSVTGPAKHLVCDTVASSGGWSPVIHLSSHTGSRPVWNEDIAGFVPGDTVQKQHSCGGLEGIYALSKVISDGFNTGAIAAQAAGKGDGHYVGKSPTTSDPQEDASMALFHIPHSKKTSRAPKQFVDYQNDVTAAGIELANREGFESIEHVKRYTALGFGTDQGKLGNINGMAITAKSLGKTIPETGTTIFRPMYTPTTFGALAGADVKHLFDPARFSAMHKWHLENGAEFEDVGQWKRPWYFPQPGETMQQSL
ncbi:MAG TPA: sarcosine oxidase subunit alpha, partial [Colwellia sp.]|nr:sarcosine oxidase subunit alpha [Colwellia sp.]